MHEQQMEIINKVVFSIAQNILIFEEYSRLMKSLSALTLSFSVIILLSSLHGQSDCSEAGFENGTFGSKWIEGVDSLHNNFQVNQIYSVGDNASPDAAGAFHTLISDTNYFDDLLCGTGSKVSESPC